MNNVTIIGDGGWGTALALVLQRNNHNVTVWGYSEKNIDIINKRKTYIIFQIFQFLVI